MKRLMRTTESGSVLSPMRVLVAGLVCAFSGLATPALPPNWWTGLTADEILKKSDEVMAGLESYRAYKPARISTDQGLATEELFRRLPSGQIQKKNCCL